MAGSPRRRLRQVRWSARSRLAEHQAYIPLARLRHGHAAIADDTELVIDGFTRTAGTFALVAFQLAQPSPVRVAHHLHAPAHLIAAARRGIPALLLIREPDETALSCVTREPHVTLRQALHAYERFHTRLLPYRHAMVVADFGDVTSDFGAVTQRVNRRFGTSFTPFQHTPQSLETAYWVIDARASAPPWGEAIGAFLSGFATFAQLEEAAQRHAAAPMAAATAVPQLRVQRPSEAKEERKLELRRRLDDPSLADARARARRAYDALLDGAG
jgi:hypothetical protein